MKLKINEKIKSKKMKKNRSVSNKRKNNIYFGKESKFSDDKTSLSSYNLMNPKRHETTMSRMSRTSL